MIQQSTASVPANWLPTPCKSSDHGPRISVAAGVISFFKALHPDYASGSIQMELPTLCADPPETGFHSLLQRGELAAKVACACAGLPATLVSGIGGAANLSAVVRWIGSNLALLGADNVASRGDENQSHARDKQRHRTCHQPGRLPKTAIGLGAASCLGIVGAVPTSGQEHWIVVDDSSVLDKIGRDPAYPLEGRYRQLVDIDASGLSGPVGNESHPFAGEYDGRCHSIDKLRHCFVQKLDGNGRIDNVRFTRANISSSKEVGVVACELSGSATLGNIVVEHSTVGSNGTNAPAGIGAGVANNKTLINGFRTFNCTTKTSGIFSPAGAVAGVVHGTIDNTRLDSARVETFGPGSDAGGGAGVVKANAMVANTLLVRSNLSTNGIDAYAGGGGGMVAGAVINTTMAKGRIEASGEWAFAAVGAGFVGASGKLVNTTGQRVVVRTSQWGSAAAVGAGLSSGDIEGVVCSESEVVATHELSGAALGVSWLAGRAVGIVACQCRVRTYGPSSSTGLGFNDISSGGDLRNLTVIYSRTDALGKWASEDVHGGVSPFFCSTSVGDKYESPPCCNHSTEEFCLPVPEDACKLADHRVLTSDCRPVVPPYFDAETGYDFVCPALPPLAAPIAAMSTAALAGGIVVGVVVLGLAGFAFYRHYHHKNGTEEEMVRLINSDGL